jgi:hypothetical protein
MGEMISDTGPTGGVRASVLRSVWLVIVAVALTSSLMAMPAASGVGPTATALTAAASPTTVVYGSYVRVSGALTAGGAPVPGRSLIVEYKAAGSSAFVQAGSVWTLDPGTYVAAVKPSSSGVLRVRSAGDAGYAASVSGSTKVTVKADPYMYAGTRIVRLGRPQTVSVLALPSHRGARVTIFRLVGRRWVRWATGLTNSSSRFTKSWRPTSTGSVQWRAYFAGDSSHAANYSRTMKTSCQRAPSAAQHPGDAVGPSLTSASVLPGAISPDGNGIDDSATFKFRTSETGKAMASVYTIGGRFVRTLAGWQSKYAGYCTYVWDGKDSAGHRVADDFYVFRGYALDHPGNTSVQYPIQASVRVGLGPSRSWSPLRRISQGRFNVYVEEVSTAQGPDGSLHVVLHEGDAVAYKKLDRYGNTVINTVNIPGVSTGHSKMAYPAVTAAADGSATVMWREYHGPGDEGRFALQMDSAGRIDRPYEYLYSDATRYSEMSIDASGNMHTITLGGNYQPSYGVYAPDLTPLSSWAPLTWDVRTQNAAAPSLIAEPNGTAHSVWFDARSSTTSPLRYQVYYSKIGYGPGRGADDSRSVNQLAVTSRPLGYAENADEANQGALSRAPSIDVDADGNAHIAWAQGGRHVSYAKIAASGAIAVRETTVAADAGLNYYPTYQARLKARLDGGADIVFPRTPAAPSPSTRLAHLRLNSNGAPVATLVDITPSGVPPEGLCMTRLEGDLRVVFIGLMGHEPDHRLFYLDQTNNPQAFDKTRPDLMVDDAHSTNGAPPKEGQTVGMSVQVSNCGWVTSTASSAEWVHGSTTFATSTIPPLGVDAACSISATWTVPAGYDVSPAWIKVKVDPANRIAETSENNNETMHRVPVRLRPIGTSVYARCQDETFDEALDGGYGATGLEATITGTIGAGEPGAGTPVTRHTTGGRGSVAFWDVRPGAYDITASATGYLPSRVATHVVVTRSAIDPYLITYTPSSIDFWFNQWGELTGRCTSNGATGLTGVKADVTALGKSAMSAVGGTYTVTKLFEGSCRVTFTKDGYQRVTHDVTIAPAGITYRDAIMPATTKGYVDVTVVNEAGMPIAGQTVVLHTGSSSGPIVGSQVSDGNGLCTFEPAAGQTYYLTAARQYYVTAQQTVNVPTAGHVYQATLEMKLNRTLVSAKSSQLAMISWVEHEKTIFGDDVYVLWGTYWTKVGVQYVKIGDTWHVLGVDATVKGNPSYLSLLRPSVKIPTGGPIPLPSKLTIPDLSDTYSNVRVDRVELVNASTGQVYWTGSDYDVPWYSSSPASRQQTRSWPSDSAPWPPDGIAVGTGDNWAIKMWVRIGNQDNDRPETHYWAAAPILSGYKNDYQVITYYPASVGTSFNPMGKPMYIDKVHFGYPGW